ncbi:TonB-linked SusC/RagA family outer membrane protein [Pontibacter ummariensis]|uniref:TonB-linked outer membrane protein, SusC/RagA family n=1 Tax=Pontibacter ummariensis TaxID=1610492 RepID=A0A239H1V3_9BACT|nr:TonB-dependent receptor [Pontibacter ummariensis]PRY10921.1 TonB-linked SusC/RagA family outer membrane protein [Pontibacter ummariensis]SNS75370.1 TonB-linked outer membrane protein, SusC/RagA family [Pontibacter ummariensis]
MRNALLKRIRVLLVLPLIFAAVAGALAQGVAVTGKVVDEKGEGLPGVTVLLKGTTKGTATGVDGTYTLPGVDGEGTLLFSFIGYEAREVAINGRSTINVSMAPDQKALEEVVIIGYTAVPRSELTSSVSSVGAKQLKDVPVSTAAEALAGRLAGVQVTTSEGQPGAEIQIRVRGGGSITQDNSPLYIVDGIQMENALSILSPQEIESIDVLKDAASTAIYGARGANGVVVITTKGGVAMPTQVTYNGFTGVRSIVNKLDVMKPYDYVKYQHEIYNYNTDEETRRGFTSRYGLYEDIDIYKNMPFMDWQEEVFGRDASSQTHVLGVTGGTEKTSFNFTLNHTDEEGIMLNSGFQRTLASFKFDHRASDKLRVGLSTRYSRQKVEGVGTSHTGSQGNNRLRNAVRFRPFVAPGMENTIDEFDPEFANLTNLISPVLLAREELREDYRNDILVNGWFSYELLKNLTYKTVVGITNTNRDRNDFDGPHTSLARQNAGMPVVEMRAGESLALTNSNTLNYKFDINSDHKFNLLLGHEIWQRNDKTSTVVTKYLPVDITAGQAWSGIDKATPPSGLIQDAPSTFEEEQRLLSYFGRVSYSFRDKYRAVFNMRRDASSLFSPENRVGYFPSASLAWHIAEESFMAGSDAWLSDLKLRLSMGEVGNNRIGVDLWKTMFTNSSDYGYAFSESVTPGFVSSSLANSNLTWETTVSRNLGLDFSILNNRISGSIDVYKNSTRDLLLLARIPQTSGYSDQLQNIGRTENKGLEVQLSGVVVDSKDFFWNANFNVAFNRNKIVSLGVDSDGNPLRSYLVESGWVNNLQDFLVEVGQPIGQYYGYVTDGFYTVDDFNATFNEASNTWTYTLKEGVPNTKDIALGNRDPQPGDLKLKDLTDDGNYMITPDDRKVLGTSQPKFIGGFNQQFAYKGFDLSVFFNFSYGNKVYNANKIEFTTQYLYRDNNMLTLMNDRWRRFDDNGQLVTNPEQLAEMNKDAKYWTPPLGQYFLHSFAIEDGSYLRISNVTLGYSLPERLVEKTKVFSKFRVYATVNNLLTLTGYTGYDPEANTRRSNPLTPGVDYAAYPRSRYVLGGVNVTF